MFCPLSVNKMHYDVCFMVSSHLAKHKWPNVMETIIYQPLPTKCQHYSESNCSISSDYWISIQEFCVGAWWCPKEGAEVVVKGGGAGLFRAGAEPPSPLLEVGANNKKYPRPLFVYQNILQGPFCSCLAVSSISYRNSFYVFIWCH